MSGYLIVMIIMAGAIIAVLIAVLANDETAVESDGDNNVEEE